MAKESIFFFKEISVPALSAGAMILYDEEVTLKKYRKFTPFSNIQVVNTSNANLEIILDYNPDKKLIVLSGGTKALRNQPFRAFSIKNTDVSVSTITDDVIIELETIR